MTEYESHYIGYEPPETVEEELFVEAAPKRGYTPDQIRRSELRPDIQRAKQRLAERVLVEVSDEQWRAKALCAYLPPHLQELFTTPGVENEKRAKIICENCSAIEQCLDFAVSTNEMNNVYGGLSASDRRKMRRRQRL